MKNVLLLFSLLFALQFCSPATLRATRSKNIYITLNVNDCIKCIMNLDLLQANKQYDQLYFVFKTALQEDSSLLVSNLYLDKYQAAYIWSDSLYAFYNLKGASALNYVVADSIWYRVVLEHFKGLPTLGSQQQPTTDTLLLNNKIFKSDIHHHFNTHDREISFWYNLRNMIAVFSLENGSLKYSVSLKDSTVRAAYRLALGAGHDEWQLTHLKNKKIPNISQISGYHIHHDTMTLMSEHVYFGAYRRDTTVHIVDTVLMKFCVVHTYVKGHLLKLLHLPTMIVQDYQAFPYFFYRAGGDTLILPVSYLQRTTQWGDKYLYGVYDAKGSTYQFAHFLPFTIDTHINIVQSFRSANYHTHGKFVLPKAGVEVFDMEQRTRLVLKDIMKYANITKINAGEIPFFHYSFKKNDTYIWLLTQMRADKKMYFIKYHIATARIEAAVHIYLDPDKHQIGIDEMDHDRIIYLLHDQGLVRKKIFY